MSEQIYTLAELAKTIGAEVRGDAQCKIKGVASIAHAQPGDICYLVNSQYRPHLLNTKASAVLLSKKFISDCPTNALVMANPQLGFAKLLEVLYPKNHVRSGIHPTAVIGEGCEIDSSVTIAPHVVIEDNVTIGSGTIIGSGTVIGEGSSLGAHCHLHPNVTLYHHVVCGDRVILHSGVVIGADGFGMAQDEQKQWVKIPQIGRVVIGNDVEIGANSAIDRGALNDTVIGNGVKIDNQVMIGHNCHIGDHTVIAGCAGIAGSTKVGRHCMIGASAGLNGHIEICDHVMITGFGMIQKSITEPGIYSSGTGMQTNREWHKSVIRFWQLDDIAKRLKHLERLHDDSDGK
ncbi:UDP-3-O-(3-hydroxymyristoyl)glucosamine N-acyltransferase [Candidiatus Paracoxiella cheracis]|uniref:UDP-3-O-(3-hydroxymyristoyl)glucosamine N-acyltransferase n=1 Tax=Candidiatus Paracoxiella cheracis TaxID=3405120 RepID=UPI003BF46E1F